MSANGGRLPNHKGDPAPADLAMVPVRLNPGERIFHADGSIWEVTGHDVRQVPGAAWRESGDTPTSG